jgi:hypothetical protein
MSEEEYRSASTGKWADSLLVANTDEAGVKWLWTSKKAAKAWCDKMVAAGEVDLVVARVPTAHRVVSYPRFPHPPEGTAIQVPISDLGVAERIV